MAATFLVHLAGRSGISSFNLLSLGTLLIALTLTLGFLTPCLSFVVGLSALVSLFVWARPVDGLILSALILNASALALLGPGAYSIDARLFGRRVVVVPPQKNSDRT